MFNIDENQSMASTFNKRQRPQTAKSQPRFMQKIHGEIEKDNTFKMKQFYYRDLALIRFNENENAQVVNENQFLKIFLLRNNDPFWKTIDYVQTNVKSQVGIGTPIVIKFYADLEPKNKDNRLSYNHSKFGKESEIKNELIYCLKQCYKICEHIQRVHMFEILKMRVQFMKDDDGKIWLNYARDIVARKLKFDVEKHLILKEVQDINNQATAELVRQVNEHLDTAKSVKNIYSIYKVMEKHYNIMKTSIGVDQMLDEDSQIIEEEAITEDVYKTLRPGSPYKLKELVNQKKFSPKKYINEK